MSESRSPSAEIRQRMRAVRARIPAEYGDARSEVRRALDWRHHASKHPYALFGLAAGLGYLLVPRRKLVLRKINTPLDRFHRQINVVPEAQAEKTVAKASLASMLISTITTLALRAGTSFATQQLLKRFQPPVVPPVPEYTRR